MTVRHKQTVLNILHKHFTEFDLPLDIQYKSYVSIVGSREALNAVSIKRSFKAWKYALLALRKHYPELEHKPEPVAVVEPPKPSGLDALRSFPVETDEDE